tara:strand:+ start:11837 stop:12988 length:1152 start_codon:yes stop_codon:yes gene_type:complete
MKNLAILGSTGSVGRSTLDVVRRNNDKFQINLLTANKNFKILLEQVHEFQPKFIYLNNPDAQKSLVEAAKSLNFNTTFLTNEDELMDILSSQESEIIVAAMVGVAGLKPVHHAVKNGKQILLANKESYVVAGEMLNNLSIETGSTIFPIDSEHSAIHQCLTGIEDKGSVSRIILTGSGGPFLDRDINDLDNITPEEATSHPIWKMGKKISVDSSTMMNKCLEIIEARWLFNVKDIDVLIHPQGIIHSLVEFTDKSIIAQLSEPDMKIPIAYGLAFPERITSGSSSINFDEFNNLSFRKPDFNKFPALGLAKDCIEVGGSSFAILNAANEECVDAFLEGKIKYLDIFKIITNVLDKSNIKEVKDLNDIFESDLEAREISKELIN